MTEHRPTILRTCCAAVVWTALAATAQDDQAHRLVALARNGTSHDLPSGGYLGVAQALRDARNDCCVALVASHPDDQYVLPAAWLRQHGGYRVVVVLFTRGEGGQNSEGPEVGDALGARRTLETEACGRRLGVEIHHLNRGDAGYCRTGAEALELWGAEPTAEALATVLRKEQVDYVITTHHPEETHGHDLGLLAVLPRAIELARDSAPRPDALPPAPIRRVLRGATAEEDGSYDLPIDAVDPDRGETWRSIAYRALVEEHRSQAPFRSVDVFFGEADRLVDLDRQPDDGVTVPLGADRPDLFQAVEGRVDPQILEEIRNGLEDRLPALRTDVPALVREAMRLRQLLETLPIDPDSIAAVRRDRRTEALERLIRHALGLRIRTRIDDAWTVAVPGAAIPITFDANTIGDLGDIRVLDLRLIPRDLGSSLEVVQPFDPGSGGDAPWHLTGRWLIPDDALRADPLSNLFRRERFEMPFAATAAVTLADPEGNTRRLEFPIELPLAIRPAVELSSIPDSILVPDGVETRSFNVRIRRHGYRSIKGVLRVEGPPGIQVEPALVEIDMTTQREQGHRFQLTIPPGLGPGPQPLRVSLGQLGGRLALHRVRVHVPSDLRVGLIEGVDDASHLVLRQIGCTLVTLTEADLPTRSLDDLDTIVIDIRALRHHTSARAEFNRLVDFARRGGRLVVLYHKDTEFNVESVGTRFHPGELPFQIGKGRVTREDAPVTALIPDHDLLQWPNRIRTRDWDGWSQERGLYFAESWADGFTPILELHDPGHPPERGALLYGRVGEGEFIYCALALHRQLKNLHPGACRLFANLISTRDSDGRR